MLLDENIFRNQCHVLATSLTMGLKYMEIFTPYLCSELLAALPKNIAFDVCDSIRNALEIIVQYFFNILDE